MGTGADVAVESAGITLLNGDLTGIVRARKLAIGSLRNIRQNLFLAFVYNSAGVPIASRHSLPLHRSPALTHDRSAGHEPLILLRGHELPAVEEPEALISNRQDFRERLLQFRNRRHLCILCRMPHRNNHDRLFRVGTIQHAVQKLHRVRRMGQ